jgi:FkbM family methyltransferase
VEITLADLFMMQLAGQAGLYDLSNMQGRAYSARCLADVFVTVFGDVKASCAIEVGAHEASFSRAVREKAATAKIFAFEGNLHVHKRYCDELAARDIRYINALVTDVCGEGIINILAKIDGKDEPRDGKRHSLLARIDHEDVSEKLAVSCLSLDSVFMGKDFADDTFCLWIDAEGAGGKVLRGAEKILKNTAAVYIEVESVAKWHGQALDKDIVEFFLHRGFLPLLRDFQFRHQYNIIFVRRDIYTLVERAHLAFLSHRMKSKILWEGRHE